MKITGGTARGVALFEGHGLPIRPAQAIVRSSIFNIQGDVSGMAVLDLFSGTGSLGCEALSRGASWCVFMDRDRRCVALIKKNLAKLKFEHHGVVLPLDVFRSLKVLQERGEDYSLVFVAPPYDFFRNPVFNSRLGRWLSQLACTPVLSVGAVMVVEHPLEKGFEVPPAGLDAFDSRRYGQTALTFYKKTSQFF